MATQDRFQMALEAIEQLKYNCPPFLDFYNEVTKAASKGLLQQSIQYVNCEYTMQGDRIISLKGSIAFNNPEFVPQIQPKTRWKITDMGDFVNDPAPYVVYQERLHEVAKHIIERYGKYLVDVSFGPQQIASNRFGSVYVMDYTWNYILP